MTQERPPSSRHWIRIVLPVSLVLNAFCVAFTAGLFLHHNQNLVQHRGATTLLGVMLANAERALPPADAVVFRRVMIADAPRYQGAALRLAQARAALEQQIITEPYDSEAVQRAFVSWQASWNQLNDALQGPLVDALGQVSAEGRRKLVAQRRKMQTVSDYISPAARPGDQR